MISVFLCQTTVCAYKDYIIYSGFANQGRRKVSNIGEAPIKSVAKFPENIGGAQLLTAPNIGGPCSYDPVVYS